MIRFYLLFSVLIFSWNHSYSKDIAPPEYRVTDVEGDAGFVPKGGTAVSPVVGGLTFEPGDRLITGKKGRVEFATKEGTVLELKENSSLSVDSFSSQTSRFFLRLGKLFGKFAPASHTKHSYNINTPVAVASIRGTELAMCVEDTGETEAGVVEGQVAFGPVGKNVNLEGTAETKPDWTEGEVLIGENKGIRVKSNQRPARLEDLPPIVTQNLDWFPHVRERVPTLRQQWKDRTPPEKLKLRQAALRELVKWTVPEKMQPLFVPPSHQQPDRPQPKHQSPPHPHSKDQ